MRRRRSNGRLLVGAAIVTALVLTGATGAWAWSHFDLADSRLVRAIAGGGPSEVVRKPVASAVASDWATTTSTAEATSSAETTLVASAESSAPAESESPTITIAAVGDMLFDRKVKSYIQSQGGEAPLKAVAKRLSGADIAIGNLETVLGTTGKKIANKEFTFRGHPDAIEGLKLAGFDALSLANNHALDYGKDPLKETVEALDDAGIAYAGAGPSIDAAWEPAVIERSGTRTAFLAFTHVLPPGFLAGKDRWGVASGRNEPDMFKKAVAKAKKENDYVIVSFHWGIELEDDANGNQVKWAHRAIDAGADMVLAHHPHVIQGVEFYKDGLIAYSLGDFVWDYGSPKGGEAFILEAELGPNGVANVTATPVRMNKQTGKPDEVEGQSAETILERLKKISAKHGTEVEVGWDRARLLP